MREPVLHSDVCEEKYRDTPNQNTVEAKATHLRCVEDQIKAAPCAAFLSYSNLEEFAQLRDGEI